MKKKMYKAKKHWVVAGVTTASLFLAPTVLAQEAAPATAVVVDETTGGSDNVTPQPTTDVNDTAETMDSSESSNLSAEATILAAESQSLDYSASASASVATVSSTVSGTADVNTSR
ncbi:KxYKxGKxW signal peptide domain-containing protein, partial [Streptococcus thoraltensis]|uniref:KxYKxGKxW signal peptide domain-containing protein n=1 Tax=Streptococcus thoraltensis TaxID=55085 RepID=UPI001F5622A2